MRILQLSKHYPPYFGGIESVTYDLTEGINKLSFTCDVLCANNRLSSELSVIGNYKVYRMSSLGKLMSTSISPALIYKLKVLAGKYDIIHVHFPDPMSALAIYLTRPKAKLVVHWHSDIIKQKQVLKLFRPLQNWILRRADVIIGTTLKYLKESEQLRDFQDKSLAIPIGIASGKISEHKQKVCEIKERYKGKKIIFSLGRMVYYKGYEYLVETGQYLKEDTVILIGGVGPLYEMLQDKIKKEGLEDKVILLGKIPQGDLGSYLSACDIFCLPSVERSEAFGVVILEAMMFGKPVIATDIPGSGVSWVNEDGVTGFNVPIRNARALAEKILLLSDDDALYRQFSRNARERYEKHFTDDIMVKAFVKVYTQLISQ